MSALSFGIIGTFKPPAPKPAPKPSVQDIIKSIRSK